jgi:hypothetical protein
MPSTAEPTTLDDLIADSRAMPHLFDPHAAATTTLAEHGPVRIPEPAFALVAGLDTYV